MEINTHELAWAAGFFDGEGHARCTKRTDSPAPRLELVVAQFELTTLERFQTAVLGMGHIYTEKRPKPSGKYSSAWRSVTYSTAQMSAVLLWPWLSAPKREQIYAAMLTYHQRRKDNQIRRYLDGGLTPQKIAEIQQARLAGLSRRQIMAKCQISEYFVRRVVQGESQRVP